MTFQEEDVRKIVREETAHLVTKDDLRKVVGPLATASSAANLATRVDSVDRKIDKLLGTVDAFAKGLEKEEQERTSADRLIERRVETLEQGQPAH